MKKYLLLLLLPLALAACKQIDYTSVVDYHPAKGPELAQVRIVEWADFQCPACRSAYLALDPIFDQYQDRIRVEYKHIPLTSIHALAFNAATASECAADQNTFWEYHDTLFENQPALKRSDLITYAENLGLDKQLFSDCFDSHAKNNVVKADMAEAASLGINSTPTFFLNEERVEDWTTIPQLLAELFPDSQATSTATSTVSE